MKPWIVPCPHCAGSSQLDPERLPDGPVQFPCPHCGDKVVVDKRQMQDPAPGAAETPAPPDPPTEPAAAATEPPAATADRRFARVPEGARFPSGIILGEDEDSIREIQEKLAALGSEVERIESAAEAREVIVNEQPEMCVFVAGPAATLPYEPMIPLTGLPPDFRRRLYLVLVADNLKTLDGNAAFLYQVNMTLCKSDLAHLEPALYTGVEYHERLYRPFFEAAERRSAI